MSRERIIIKNITNFRDNYIADYIKQYKAIYKKMIIFIISDVVI